MLLCFGQRIPFRRVKNPLPAHNPVALAHDCGMSGPPTRTVGERNVTIRVQDAPNQPALIEIEGLTKHFGSFVAVDHVVVQRAAW